MRKHLVTHPNTKNCSEFTFKAWTLKLKEKEITESSLQQVCVCMKTSLDISICETKADILLLGKCLACTQDSYHNCLNHNLKSPISQIIWGQRKNGNPNIPVIFALSHCVTRLKKEGEKKDKNLVD